jgi:hypothetical protein
MRSLPQFKNADRKRDVSFVLAAAFATNKHLSNALPLGSIRSLAYFLPVIEEVLGL